MRPAQEQEGADVFSYSLAAASLERGAAKSLEAHGVRPAQQTSAGKAQPADGSAVAENAASGKQPADFSNRQVKSVSPSGAEKTAGTGAPTQSAISAAAPTIAQAAPIAAPPSATMPAKTAEIASLRNASAAKMKAATAKAPRLAQAPTALKEAFAEVLARRLEKTSIFDLRLDPPDLGRVEGRLSVNDDGKAVLSLTFDNQNAFDLFSRDEQALRTALQQAGLEFGSGDFAFAFREPRQIGEPPTALVAASGVEALALYDPVFMSDWTAGAVDLRI